MDTITDEQSEPESEPKQEIEVSKCSCAAPANPTALELEVYKALTALFNSEETSFWARNNILVVVQGALIGATAAILAGSDKVLSPGTHPTAAILLFLSLAVLSIVGLLMAIAWLFMVGRSERIADTILGQLKNIEAEWCQPSSGVNLGGNFHAFINFGAWLDSEFKHECPKQTDPNVQKAIPRKKWNNNVRLSVLWQKVGFGLAGFWAVVFILFVWLALTVHPEQTKVAVACSADTQATENVAVATMAAAKSAASAEISVKLSAQAAASAEAAAKAAQLARRRSAAPACGCCGNNNAGKLPN